MADRFLSFDGIDNFRDYGGYAVSGGGRLRDGVLYRSAHYCDATARDLAALATLGIAAVIDLRGPNERVNTPSPRRGAFTARIFEAGVETAGAAPHIALAIKGATNVEEAHRAMRAFYADMPRRPAVTAALRTYFEALLAASGPSLIHCTAGKDRTGVAVALLHAALGVHRDDIVADYLLSNTGGRFEQQLAAAVVAVRRNFGGHLDDETARALASVEPGCIEATFATIDETWGGPDCFLEAELGIDAGRRETLRRHLLV